MGSSPSTYGPGRLKVKLTATVIAVEALKSKRSDSEPKGFLQADDIPKHSLNKLDREILKMHYHPTLLETIPDIFEKTLIQAIQSSTSLRRVIMENYQCVGQNIYHWKAIATISDTQRAFYDKILHIQHLDKVAVANTVYTFGMQSFHFSVKSFNPHFIDLWMRIFHENAKEALFEDEDDKDQFLASLKKMNNYILHVINKAYRYAQRNLKAEQTTRENSNSSSIISGQPCSSNLAVKPDALPLSTKGL